MARTWFKQMHGFYRHPKTIQAGEDAADLFVRGIDYCTEYLTDGFIPDAALRELSKKRAVRQHAKSLERVGYWDRDTDGWWVHHFDDHHPSKADVEAKREKERLRKGKGKKRGNRTSSARVPRGNPRDSAHQITDGQMADGQTTDVPQTEKEPSSITDISTRPVVRAESDEEVRAHLDELRAGLETDTPNQSQAAA